MSNPDQTTASPGSTKPATSEQIAVAIEGWQSVTGFTFSVAPQEVWEAAAFLRTARATMWRANGAEQTAPATVFLPAGAGMPVAGPRDSFRLSAAAPVRRPDHADDLAFLSVTHLARLIETQQLSPVELTRVCLNRCVTHDAHLYSVVTLLGDTAVQQARTAEAEIRAGRYRGPLHGIPWGIKDIFYTRGVPTSYGLAAFKDRIVDQDATVVERLRDAGAILIAKLSPNGDRQGPWFGGRTRNPWDVTQGVADGSSAGPATATAAGLVGFGIGQENTGSIIWPAFYCGVVGLRPTFGRVSRFGSPLGGATMGKIGPICRTVEDCALVFAAIYGPDGKDWTVVDAPFRWHPPSDLSGLRIGYLHRAFDAIQDVTEQALYTTVLEVLRAYGAALVPMELPYNQLYEHATYLMKWAEDTWEGGVDPHEPRVDADAIGAGYAITAVDLLQAQAIRTMACCDMRRLFTQCDVFVYPGKGEECMWATNWTGNPALQLPCGFVTGMPRGIAIVGKPYDEAGVLHVGHVYEQATPWHEQHPVLS